MKDWQRVEAVLFGSGKYLTEDQICELSMIPKNKLKRALSEFQKHYDSIETSLKVFHESDTWKLNIKEEFNDIMKNIVSDAEMARPIMETLATIAYKAPILQSDVIDARGSGAYEHIGLLEEKGFVVKEKFGRTFKLRLGDKFYDYFDIEGPAQIQSVFADAKKPKKIGSLEVYESSENDEGFHEKITERLKKIEVTEQDNKEREDFLDKFDQKISDAKTRIDETEKEMSEMKRPDEDNAYPKQSEDTSSQNSDDTQDEQDDEQFDDELEEKPKKKAMTTEEILKKVDDDIDEITNNTGESSKD